MTKAKVLREYFKKFYNLDTNGMSSVQVLRDFMKKKFNHESKATSFIGAVRDMIDNNLALESGGGSDIVVDTLPSIDEADDTKTYLMPMIDVWTNGYVSKAFVEKDTWKSYAADFIEFTTIVFNDDEVNQYTSDGLKGDAVTICGNPEGTSRSNADSKPYCSLDSYHLVPFNIMLTITDGVQGKGWVVYYPDWMLEYNN